MLIEVQALAEREQTTVVEVMRRFIKLGLLATRIQETPDASLVLREGGRERELLLLRGIPDGPTIGGQVFNLRSLHRCRDRAGALGDIRDSSGKEGGACDRGRAVGISGPSGGRRLPSV